MENKELISLVNTILGIANYEKNTTQHEEQKIMIEKLDKIINLLEKGAE